MKFRVDSNLKMVAGAMAVPMAPEQVAVSLFNLMVDTGLIDNDEDNWSLSVAEATATSFISQVCAVLADFLGIPYIKSEILDAFEKTIIIGDGNCPDCGGNLCYLDTYGHEEKTGSYDVPNSYEIDGYIYQCENCGTIYKTETEL